MEIDGEGNSTAHVYITVDDASMKKNGEKCYMLKTAAMQYGVDGKGGACLPAMKNWMTNPKRKTSKHLAGKIKSDCFMLLCT